MMYLRYKACQQQQINIKLGKEAPVVYQVMPEICSQSDKILFRINKQ